MHEDLKDSGRESGLPPLLGASPGVLVLGSFPSRMSLSTGRYYANPRNHFWSVMRELLSLEGEGIPAWEKGLTDAGIAVWDMIASRRYQQGSLDRDICGEEVHDLPGFLTTHPTIRCICLNGGKAHESFRRAMRAMPLPSSIRVCPLPSTSPANARYTLQEKIARWKVLLEYLGQEGMRVSH